jgi:hypothetical protein
MERPVLIFGSVSKPGQTQRGTMADTSLWPIVLTGLFTLSGSLGGIGVGLIGAARRDKEQERRDDRKRRAEKFEELVAALYEFDHWLLSYMSMDAFAKGNAPQTVSPIAKMQSISAVYFPQFDKSIASLERAASRFMYRAAKTDIERSDPGFDEANQVYVNKRDVLFDDLKAFAQEHFQYPNQRRNDPR